ncbi:hypothetical protein MGYG_04811 [Nannizzia gypsea CBS 118893]|uniref:Secreted protein n=1 Tax=Arthroderma gypseum (strain ATCC MYA-4604 / CBS 118893) TaxID=535722 RepID=E4UWV7_ARTGP|nr:hypothetical protein MGYG_04811 [Nannizzia gypsea CBS 118893]EFR01810.1 hypothetical protein MGYG_04811 [Nannizzia gypsea CBS 118893]
MLFVFFFFSFLFFLCSRKTPSWCYRGRPSPGRAHRKRRHRSVEKDERLRFLAASSNGSCMRAPGWATECAQQKPRDNNLARWPAGGLALGLLNVWLDRQLAVAVVEQSRDDEDEVEDEDQVGDEVEDGMAGWDIQRT